MILPAHNAHLTSVQSPAVAADPGLNITGQPATNRWTGDCQAYVDEDTSDVVVGNERVTIQDTFVDLPMNFPQVGVMPNPEDILNVTYLTGGTDVFVVRQIDRGLIFSAGKIRFRCRRT